MVWGRAGVVLVLPLTHIFVYGRWYINELCYVSSPLIVSVSRSFISEWRHTSNFLSCDNRKVNFGINVRGNAVNIMAYFSVQCGDLKDLYNFVGVQQS